LGRDHEGAVEEIEHLGSGRRKWGPVKGALTGGQNHTTGVFYLTEYLGGGDYMSCNQNSHVIKFGDTGWKQSFDLNRLECALFFPELIPKKK